MAEAQKKVMDFLGENLEALNGAIADRMGDVEKFTIVTVIAGYDDRKSTDVDNYDWILSVKSVGWDPSEDEKQGLIKAAKKAAVTYGGCKGHPRGAAFTVEDTDDGEYAIGGSVVYLPEEADGSISLGNVENDVNDILYDLDDLDVMESECSSGTVVAYHCDGELVQGSDVFEGGNSEGEEDLLEEDPEG